jgi:hypothetical protein
LEESSHLKAHNNETKESNSLSNICSRSSNVNSWVQQTASLAVSAATSPSPPVQQITNPIQTAASPKTNAAKRVYLAGERVPFVPPVGFTTPSIFATQLKCGVSDYKIFINSSSALH